MPHPSLNPSANAPAPFYDVYLFDLGDIAGIWVQPLGSFQWVPWELVHAFAMRCVARGWAISGW